MSRAVHVVLILCGSLLSGCGTPKPGTDLLATTEEQTKLRSFQSRTLDLHDRQTVLRGVIAVLQDLGFIVERANEALGLVSAAKFSGWNVVGVTVTVRPQGGSRVLVRINAIYNNQPVEDPEVYQKFFASLERSLFLTGGPP